MRYLIALSLCMVVGSPAYAGGLGTVLKRGAALTVMPVVCLSKATCAVTVKVVKLPLYLSKGLLDGAEQWSRFD